MGLGDAFPPPPRGLRGRKTELATLAKAVAAGMTRRARGDSGSAAARRIALVGTGGSGKSMLAAALAYRVVERYPGGLHWFRIGAWDSRTLLEMFALRFGTSRDRHALVPELRAFLAGGGERLIVLDNHEVDEATARLLETFGDLPVTFVITARRCLLAGVLVFPVTAPLVTSGTSSFPRVATLTRALRWNPLALDIANAIVTSGAATEASLFAYLERRGVLRVRVVEHEDDLPEVSLLLEWAWPKLPPASRRMLGVLAYVEGDHVDLTSLATLARARDEGSTIAALERLHLVQEPAPGRYALHAVVRYAARKRTTFSAEVLAPG